MTTTDQVAPPSNGRGVVAAAGAVLRSPHLLKLLAGYASMGIFEMGIWVCVLLWAYDAGGVALAGWVAFVQLAPAALLASVGGAASDRLRRDRALAGVYAAQGLLMLGLALELHLRAPTWAVVVMATLVTVVMAWTRPHHYAALAELATRPEEAAAGNALSGTTEGIGYFVGPVVAGALVAVSGPPLAAGIFALMALLSAGLTVDLGLHRQLPGSSAGTGSDPVGLARTLRRQPFIAAVLVLVAVDFLVQGAWEVLGVSYAAHRGAGAGGAGVVVGSLGAGEFVGAAAAVVLVRWRRLAGPVAGSLALAGVPLLVLAVGPPLAVTVAAGTVAGCGLGFFSVASVTALQRSIGRRQVGQVLGLRESAVLGGAAVGAVLAPGLVSWSSVAGAYDVLGVLLVVIAVAALPLLTSVDGRTTFRPDVVALLRAIPIFGVLDVVTLEGLAQGAVPVLASAGMVVVTEGEPGDGYYAVASGRLAVTVGGRRRPAALGAGDGFGEIALLRDVPRTATVEVLEDAVLWKLTREDFLRTVIGSAATPLAEAAAEAHLRADADRVPDPLRRP